MNILITGACGFIGTNLSAYLSEQREHWLIGLDVKQKDCGQYDEFYSWDEIGKIDFNQLDAIIHLAGKAHDTRNSSHPQHYFDINVGLTRTIYSHFLNSEAGKFIFFSSVKAVADSVKGQELFEDELPEPQTPYGKSKLEAEQYLLQHAVQENKRVYILRPCMIHGPGNKGNLNLLYRIQQKGLAWPLGAFENKRSFCSIDNLHFVIQELLAKEPESGIYQLADDEALSTNELIRLIAYSRSLKPKIWNVSPKSIWFIARLGDHLHLPLNSERLKKLTESYVVSNRKLKQALGIDQMPVSVRSGIRKTLDSFD